MDSNIQERLRETSQNCLESFINWEGQKKDRKAQEDLHAAIHELRKVSSRLEIELAMSERDQMAAKPLPIPAHRSNMKGDAGPIVEGNNGNNGDGGKKGKSPSPNLQSKLKRRRPPIRQKGEE